MPLLANPVADFSEDTWWIWLIKALFILVFLLLSVLMALWVERRVLGRMQTRWGPSGSRGRTRRSMCSPP